MPMTDMAHRGTSRAEEAVTEPVALSQTMWDAHIGEDDSADLSMENLPPIVRKVADVCSAMTVLPAPKLTQMCALCKREVFPGETKLARCHDSRHVRCPELISSWSYLSGQVKAKCAAHPGEHCLLLSSKAH